MVNELPEDIEMEVTLSNDGSGEIGIITPKGQRLICMTFQQGHKNGCVYDCSKILTNKYEVSQYGKTISGDGRISESGFHKK